MKLQFVAKNDGRGIQARHDFDNGYGVSVIQNEWSYGGKEGLYELAVMKNGLICYDTPITKDVVGWLSLEEAENLADQVAALGVKRKRGRPKKNDKP